MAEPLSQKDVTKRSRQEDVLDIDHSPPTLGLQKGWMRTPVDIRPSMHCFACEPARLEVVDFPNPRQWSVMDEDWKLPRNWKEIVMDAFKDRLDRFRTFKLFMDMLGRPQEHACAEGRAFAISLSKELHEGGKIAWTTGRGKRPDI